MAVIGSFGKTVTFETSDQRILSFKGFKREIKGRWASHERVGKKPLKQFLGPDADSVTFTVTLNAWHGVKPRSTLDRIEQSVKKGTPEYLVIASQRVCSGKMVITSASQTWDEIYNKGELVRASVELTLEEYA